MQATSFFDGPYQLIEPNKNMPIVLLYLTQNESMFIIILTMGTIAYYWYFFKESNYLISFQNKGQFFGYKINIQIKNIR